MFANRKIGYVSINADLYNHLYNQLIKFSKIDYAIYGFLLKWKLLGSKSHKIAKKNI
jgi:hypothetical protein